MSAWQGSLTCTSAPAQSCVWRCNSLHRLPRAQLSTHSAFHVRSSPRTAQLSTCAALHVQGPRGLCTYTMYQQGHVLERLQLERLCLERLQFKPYLNWICNWTAI
eukprot:91145-Chlamydomonas_euryale.AAC.1